MMPQSSHLQITVEGKTFHVRHGNNDGFWSSYERDVWETDTQAVFRRFIDPQHSYIDIGAWIGPTLLLGCQLAKRAYGIEPDPVAYAELCENMAYNRPLTANVKLFNICITPVSGKVSFGNRGDGGDSNSSLLFSSEKASWTVDGISFHEWIEQNDIKDCDFIKIDIEGGEYSVLPTMLAYLSRQRPTLHLSLHPCFIGDLGARGVTATARRTVLRLKSTIILLNKLRFYRYIYDSFGKLSNIGVSALTPRARRRHWIAKATWRPIVLLMACIYSIYGKPSALVLTDKKWRTTRASSAHFL